MNREKIKPRHLERRAYVYLRQSSPGQVKKNVQGQERQRKMAEMVEELGWPPERTVLLGGDTGHSGSSLHGRDDYQRLFQAVMAQEAGLIAVRELSRLVRNSQDWNDLVRLCRYKGVLLADEHRLYDAQDAQDRVLLGVQGAFNEFELAMICERMLESRIQMAHRGELYEAFPPGYVCRRPPVLEKHPDERVQRAVAKVFEEFERSPSALKMYRRLVTEGFQLPVVAHGKDWREVQWVRPTYQRLLGMLKNPTYAGIYAWGRKETVTELDDRGHVVKKRRRVSREAWDVSLQGHHEPYISKETWERNLEKLATNANMNGAMNKRSPQDGKSLLAGLVRCGRCGHRLQAHYSAGGLRYVCYGSSRQRDEAKRTCLSFTATAIEARLITVLLDAVQPAGLEAARQAAEQLRARHAEQRQLLLDRLQTCHEGEARAAREYKETDATYLEVRRKLAQEWNEAILATRAQEERLACFDNEEPVQPTPQQEKQLESLGQHLQSAWFHPKANPSLKKQIVRTLIEEIAADIDEESDEIVLLIHWAGGHHTELREPRRKRKPRTAPEDLARILDALRKVVPDAAIATVLNRENIRSDKGKTWTARRVQSFRKQHGIAAFNERKKAEEGWQTQAEAAISLGISPMSVTRLVHAGILPAEQPGPGLPAVLCDSDLQLEEVRAAVSRLKASDNRPLSQHPNQLSLYATTSC
jgi:DNA invertase Pin-like site-specific DNA recombinase